jgi:transposase
MNKINLGIDISKKKFDVCILLPNGKALTHLFHNDEKGFDELLKWLDQKQIGVCRAVMEATGRYGEELAGVLYRKGYTVFIVNPAQIKYFGMSKLSRAKTDKKDARLIAEFAATHPELKPWAPLTPSQEKLKNLYRHLDRLKADRAQLKTRMESIRDKDVKKLTQAQLEFVSSQIQELEKTIRAHIKSDPDLKGKAGLLLTIPAVGEALSWAILTEVPHLESFRDAKQFAAFVGLNPSVCESGTSVRGRGGISKTGSSFLRKMLYLPGMTAMRFNPIIKPFADALRAKGKNGKVIVIACMRKLLHIIYGVLTKQQPFVG